MKPNKQLREILINNLEDRIQEILSKMAEVRKVANSNRFDVAIITKLCNEIAIAVNQSLLLKEILGIENDSLTASEQDLYLEALKSLTKGDTPDF